MMPPPCVTALVGASGAMDISGTTFSKHLSNYAKIGKGEITKADQDRIKELTATIREQLEEPTF
jgi:actin-like ATPase involved in cell morphogenesis